MTIKVKHKVGGYYKVRSSGGVQAFLEGSAEDVEKRANAQLKDGKGFMVSSRQGAKRPQGRWRTTVAAVSPYARRANAKYHILLKSLGGGSGMSGAAAAVTAATSGSKRGTARRWSSDELSLLYGKGLSVSEIATRTGRSESAVRAKRRKL